MRHRYAAVVVTFLVLGFAIMLVSSEDKEQVDTLNEQLSETKRQIEVSRKEADKEIRRLRGEISQKRVRQRNLENSLKAKEAEANQLREKLDEVQRELLVLEAKSNNPELNSVLASILKNFGKYMDPQVALAFETTHEKVQKLVDAINENSLLNVVSSEDTNSFHFFGALLTYGVVLVPLLCCFYGMFRISRKLRIGHYVLVGNIFCLSFCLVTLLLHVLVGENESFKGRDLNSLATLVTFICFLSAVNCAIDLLALLKAEELKEILFYAVIFPLNCSLGVSCRNRIYYPIANLEPFELSSMFLLIVCILYSCEIFAQFVLQHKLKESNLLLPLNADVEECRKDGATPLRKMLTTKAD